MISVKILYYSDQEITKAEEIKEAVIKLYPDLFNKDCCNRIDTYQAMKEEL